MLVGRDVRLEHKSRYEHIAGNRKSAWLDEGDVTDLLVGAVMIDWYNELYESVVCEDKSAKFSEDDETRSTYSLQSRRCT
jgi:hypothetical protein